MTVHSPEQPDAPLNPDLRAQNADTPADHDASAPLATVSVEENDRSPWPILWAVAVVVSVAAGIYLIL